MVNYLEGVLDFTNKIECKCEEYGIFNYSSVINIKIPDECMHVSLSTNETANTVQSLQSVVQINQLTNCRSCGVELTNIAKCTIIYTQPCNDNEDHIAFIVVSSELVKDDQIITVELHKPTTVDTII